MISCNFCHGKSDSSYMYLACTHLCCLPCAFLRADFCSQELQCCQLSTPISDQTLEAIIRGKQDSKKEAALPATTASNKYSILSSPVQALALSGSTQKQNQQATLGEPASGKQPCIKEQLFGFRQPVTSTRNTDVEIDSNEQLQRKLQSRIESIRKQYQRKHELLRIEQQSAIKQLLESHEASKPSMPCSPPREESLNLTLASCRSSGSTAELTRHRSPQDGYDHILRRLESNQQRMREKMGRHLPQAL